MLLKEIPTWDRPREKAIESGVQSLSNIELLSIFLRTGTKEQNVLEIAKEILYKLENITDVSHLAISELTKIKGIGKAKAITILAAVELGRRIQNFSSQRKKITGANDIYLLLKDELKLCQQEHFLAIYLNAKAEIITKKTITIGSVNQTLFDTKEVFKWAIKCSALAIIIVHNHPSGDPTPSFQDIEMTKMIIKQSKVIDMTIIDHVIIGKTYFSFSERTDLFKKML